MDLVTAHSIEMYRMTVIRSALKLYIKTPLTTYQNPIKTLVNPFNTLLKPPQPQLRRARAAPH